MKMCSSSSSSVLLVSLCLLLCLPPCLSSDVSVNITAEPGQSVPLPCRAPNNTEIAVEWTRPGLEQEYVFVYRDGKPDPDNQLPSFKDRVELKDREMKDGDVSIILKKVTSNDTGTYECRVLQRDKSRSSELFSIVHLEVQPGDTEERGDEERGGKEGGDKGLHVGLGVGLTAAALLVVGVVALIVYRKHQAEYEAADPDQPVTLLT